ncbi:MAG: preprotein translocase subunit YajC [Phycisphaeraceae bacterium]|nr:preprotein translocase subunit YajC [Phycisphaeraceae bacterium]
MPELFHFPLTLAQEDLQPASPSAPASPSSAAPVDVTGSTSTTDASSLSDGKPAAKSQDPFGGQFMFIMIAILVVFIFFSARSGSKEKKKRAELLNTLSKGDRVKTVGGIIGTIVEIRDNDIIVKVDENNNTRIKFTKGAVQEKYAEKAE